MTGKALGVAMSIGVEGDLALPPMPNLYPSDPTTLAVEVLAQEIKSICEKLNSLFAKLRKAGYLEA